MITIYPSRYIWGISTDTPRLNSNWIPLASNRDFAKAINRETGEVYYVGPEFMTRCKTATLWDSVRTGLLNLLRDGCRLNVGRSYADDREILLTRMELEIPLDKYEAGEIVAARASAQLAFA